MSIRLSSRLQAIAESVPVGSQVIDVGTDHAMIPVWLVQSGRASHVWACDLRSGPLQQAAALIAGTGTGNRIDLRKTDGLQGFGPKDGDTVIIAGMGGETIISVLSQAPWTKEGTVLILSPHTKQELLRGFLRDHGYRITTERLVMDGTRLYPIVTAVGGVPLFYSRAELYCGAWEQISTDPLFPQLLDNLMKQVSRAAPFNEDMQEILSEFETMKERLFVT